MDVSTPRFWSDRYASGGDGWELGIPAPPLVRLLGQDRPSGTRAAVPGCGRGHDVALLASRGFETWGFDFSPAAIAAGKPVHGAHYLERDIFAIGKEFAGRFDLVWEYTCYCAIDPVRREEYAKVLHDILVPGGTLAALFYPVKEVEGGPPFRVRREEIDTVFGPGFNLVSIETPADSIERRQGAELLVRMVRKT